MRLAKLALPHIQKLKNALRTLRELELDNASSDEALALARKNLNKVYDDFVAELTNKGIKEYPGSHVAIVIADQGANLLCLTQNPGATRQSALTKTGLIGYLRPKAVHTTTQSSGPIVVAGTYQVDVDALNVRDRPSTSGATVATYRRGQTVNLDAWGVYADGYLWGRYTAHSGAVRYIAIGTQGGDWYLALRK